ncbi:MAG: hypothetical protein IJS29_07870, partial [Selenomonadaceae bacterium]|nr:hypothetical protein [Selenomonadaceae bacterium]
STLSLNFTNGATFSGNLSGNVTNASGDVVSSSIGTVNVTLDDASKLYLSGDTYVSSFSGNAANVITNGYNFYVNNSILDGTTTQEETLPSALVVDAEQSLVSASSTFTGTINLNELNNVKNVDVSATSNNVIVIGNSYDNSILGGSGVDSMYGAAGNNTLTGGAARDQFWFMGDGNATATDFIASNGETSDVVTFYNVGLNGLSRAGSQLSFIADSGAAMNLLTNSSEGEEIFLYSLDGNNIYGAKVGNYSDQSLTYDAGVNYYHLQGDGGTLNVNADGYKEIWLDNNAGRYYFGIKDVQANNTGDNILGGNNYENLLVGGSGNNSMWGGAGNDTLQGGDGTNFFWYGLNDGNDVITNSKEGDIISLYDLVIADISNLNIESGKISMTLTNGNNLTIQDSGNVTPIFWINANAEHTEGMKYQYNRASNEWQQV